MQGKIPYFLARLRNAGNLVTDVPDGVGKTVTGERGEAAVRGEVRRLRQDLYCRLNVATLNLAPLRERGEDFQLLATHLLRHFAEKYGKRINGFTSEAMDRLLEHPWPGNVRELEDAVERAVAQALGEYVSERELPPQLSADEGGCVENGFANLTLEELERLAILGALDAAGGNKSEAARQLGITRKTLHAKLQKFGEEQE